jgi:tetratricopeptide (TPR) repeat protein
MLRRNPKSGLAFYLLGNLLYDRRRHEEAIVAWENAAAVNPSFATVWRNLGIAYYNVRRDASAALEAYERAFELDPSDDRVLYERDQLWKRVGHSPEQRIAELQRQTGLVQSRDSLAVELATLYNQLGKPEKALAMLQGRHFQPWEGGEGLVLREFVRALLLAGQRALATGQSAAALAAFQATLHPPANLSESKHLLANQSDVYFWLGRACEALGRGAEAVQWFMRAVRQRGDFQQMSVRSVSDMTFWSGLALQRLGREDEARSLFETIASYAGDLRRTPPTIDYFATSLPAMLLFEDDLRRRNDVEADLLTAQALVGLGRLEEAESLLREILRRDASHATARDLLCQMQTALRPSVMG